MKPQSPQRNSQCPQKEFPLREVTEKIISCAMNRIYEAQLLTYLKALNKRIGLLINFNEVKLKDGIKRMII